MHRLDTHLYTQFARHVPKRLQLFGMFADTLQVVITELILGIYQREEALHQSGPEVWQNLWQTDAAAWRHKDARKWYACIHSELNILL